MTKDNMLEQKLYDLHQKAGAYLVERQLPPKSVSSNKFLKSYEAQFEFVTYIISNSAREAIETVSLNFKIETKFLAASLKG